MLGLTTPRFISLEGTEGCGKSTTLAGLQAMLTKADIPHITTREPGGSTLGKALRPLLLDKNTAQLGPVAELFLFMADRVQHIEEVIKPALAQGLWVLCDRYADSTIAYQGFGRGLDIEWLKDLHAKATGNFWPDITLWLDLPVQEALMRALMRNAVNKLNSTVIEGRFEAEDIAFHTRIYHGFETLCAQHPERIMRVDASGNQEQVLQNVLDSLLGLAPGA